ncbi:MAG: hypothetical protein ABIJ48_04470 [Actinomycetota bacterium]
MRRWRRRRLLVALVVLIVVVAVAYAVTRVASEQQVRREYLDRAAAFAAAEADLAERLADMVLRLEQIGRPAMVSVLDELQQGTAELARDLDEIGAPPADLETEDRYLAIAAVRWRDGVSRIRLGLIGLSEAAMDQEARDLLQEGLTDLRVGDSAFAGFVEGLDEEDRTRLGREFPVVEFVPPGSESLFDAEELSRRLILAPGLTVLENLAVADLRLDPEPVGVQVGLPVVPVSESLDADVTVANRGTVRAVGIRVILELVSQDATIERFEKEVAVLEPGALTTVSFLGLPAEPGKLYEIVISLGSEDDDPSDDRVSFTFIRNTSG